MLCELYNRLRAKKINLFKTQSISMTRTDLRAAALAERRSNQELLTIHSQVVQNVGDRVYIAFKRFLSCQSRFPRKKHPRKYVSFVYLQYGFKLRRECALYLFGIGQVRMFMHRQLVGSVQSLTIKREVHQWFAIFVTERPTPPKPDFNSITPCRIRGADLGLTRFAVFDDNESIEYPRYFESSERKLETLQKKLRNKKQGSKRENNLLRSLAKIHLHVKRKRDDWQNKCVKEIFEKSDIIVLEKLDVRRMLKRHSLAKSISDSAWARFVLKVKYKALANGKYLVQVDPWGTTQFCYNCLSWVPKDLSNRTHSCQNCHISIPRDLNSARLIKRLGIQRGPPSDGGSSPAELRPLLPPEGAASRGAEAGSHLPRWRTSQNNDVGS